MKLPRARGRSLALVAAIVPLLALFAYVALRSGPLAPVSVTAAIVQRQSITPALYGIGTVDARYTYRIGPTVSGRVRRLDVNVGDVVKAGQAFGEMDPVDLDERILGQTASFRHAEAMLLEASARQAYAASQARRYEQLFATHAVSEEALAAKRQELQVADAALTAAQADLARARSERAAMGAQRSNLRLVAPVDGVVVLRNADPGTTVVAGQAVVEVIDPASLWINVRFDQSSASGLAAGLATRIVLRSRADQSLAGHVLRLEPKADAVTEEILAKVGFDVLPELLPPVGELVEVTVDLPALPTAVVIPNSAVHRDGDRVGVWRIVEGDLRFAPVRLGATDLDGRVQVRQGLEVGEQVVVYSEKALSAGSRIRLVERIPGASQ
jgi:RND family efflux transporter MFP subunit